MDDHGLLRSQDDTRRAEIHWSLSQRQRQIRMDERDTHQVSIGVVKHEAQMIERHGLVQRSRQMAEEII